ncbi:MAG TPA: DinB family protein [Bryobacteraceae bacterium]|nr:DinB family protein [Bryobacteraceae bacterium]
MKKISILIFTALAMQVYGQMTEAAMLKNAYNGIKNNITKMAEAMPEDQYIFKATPDIRSFGQLMGHIADAQGRTCAAVAGGAMPPSASSKTSKADLVAALKNSFDICDGVFNSLSDEDSAKMITAGRGGPRSKMGTLWGLVAHSNEEYGYSAVYLRLKGITPPSSAGR